MTSTKENEGKLLASNASTKRKGKKQLLLHNASTIIIIKAHRWYDLQNQEQMHTSGIGC